MLLNTLISTLALLAPTAIACPGHTIVARNTTTGNSTNPQPNPNPNPMQLGPDTPSSPETTGYFINHVSLNVANLTASIEFYTSVFGMRHVFTYHATQHISFTYLSHSQGGRNGSAYQTTEEILRLKNNNAGHIELMYLDVPRPSPPDHHKTGKKRGNKMNHIGIIVPDLEAAQKRLEKFGVTIYKKIGEAVPEDGHLGDKYWLGDAAENLSDEEFSEIREGMRLLNWWTVFASDPDGNLLEILPLNEVAFA